MIAVFVLAIAAPTVIDITSSAAVCAVQKQRAMFSDFIANEKRELAHGGVMNKALVWHAQQLIKKADAGLRDIKGNVRAEKNKLASCDDPLVSAMTDKCFFKGDGGADPECDVENQKWIDRFVDWYLDPPSLAGSDQ